MPARLPLSPAEGSALPEVLPTLGPRDHCLIEFGLATGLRAHEFAHLNVNHVATSTPDGGFTIHAVLVVDRRLLKGGRGPRARSVQDRRLPIPPPVADLLRGYLFNRFGSNLSPENRATFLFPSRKGGRALQAWQVRHIVTRACRATPGLDPTVPYGSHTLRKTFARRVFEHTSHNLDVTRRALGHTHITTTQHYLGTTEEETLAAIAGMQATESTGRTPAATPQIAALVTR